MATNALEVGQFNSATPLATAVAPTIATPFYPTPNGQPITSTTTTVPKTTATKITYTPFVPDPKLATQSTTTLSSNKTADIANAQATTAKYAQGGVTTDATTGIATTADGSPFTPHTTPEPTPTADNGITSTGGYVGETYYAPGSQLPTGANGKPLSTTATSPTADKIFKSLNDMKVASDALTAKMVSGIESQYTGLINQQKEINTGNNAATQGSLFRSGAAQGDAYATQTQNYNIQQGVNALADLENKKQAAILAAQQAGLQNKFKLQEQINTEIASIASDQAEAGKKLFDTIQDANAKANASKIQASRDSAVADLYQQGITDTPTLLKYLNANGGDMTAEEINNTLKNIVPLGLDDLVKTLRQNGAPQSVISNVLKSPDINSAYQAAGEYGSGGTGIIGEYNFYKAQATAAGQTPVDFNTYQNMDANRKAKAAGSGGGNTGSPVPISSFDPAVQKQLQTNGFTGYGANTQSLAQQLVDGMLAPSDLSKRATGDTSYNDVLTAADKYSTATTGKHFDVAKANRDYKFATNVNTQNTLNYLTSLTGTDDGSGNLSGGNLQELKAISDSIDRTSFPAINDAKKWASLASGDPRYAQFQAVSTEVADQVAKILQGGNGGTSDAKLQQASNLFNAGFTKDQLNAVIDSLGPLLKNRAKSMVSDNPYLSDYATDLGIETTGNKTQNTSENLIQTEDDAKQSVISYGSTNPTTQALIKKMVADNVPYLQIKSTLGI